jgi:predicted RNA-binding protein with PUA-like domain
MAFWLVKSEPSSYSWEQMVKDGRTFWSGVRNFQASNNLKAMAKGDRAFFYHSGDDKAVVGIVEVVKAYYPDHTDESGKFGMVDVKAVAPVKTPVTLAAIKAEPKLKNLLLVKQSRLSVMPIDEPSWRLICSMGGVKP